VYYFRTKRTACPCRHYAARWSTVDNTRGPCTVYTFAASLMRDGTAAPHTTN